MPHCRLGKFTKPQTRVASCRLCPDSSATLGLVTWPVHTNTVHTRTGAWREKTILNSYNMHMHMHMQHAHVHADCSERRTMLTAFY